MHRHVSMVIPMMLCLSGCATIRGSQDDVIGLSPAKPVTIDAALANYYKPSDAERSGMNRRDYRDYIVSLYVRAIDAKYEAFTEQLRSGGRGSALGFDLLLLGLNGATALSGVSAARELATITAVGSGARSSIDKRLYFDQTISAMTAAMDAERASIKSEIAIKQALPAERYSLGGAIDDLTRLKQAGQVDRAITRMTKASEADRAGQQQRLNSITQACDDVSVDAVKLNQDFRNLVHTNPATRSARSTAAAEALGMEVMPGEVPSWNAVAIKFDVALCDDTKKREFIGNLTKTIQDKGI